MNLEDLIVESTTRKQHYSATEIQNALDGAVGRLPARPEMTVTYWTRTGAPVVYYTALNTDGSIITPRTTSGVVFANGLWQAVQSTSGLTDFIAVWDEGDADDYTSEWITVDT